MVVAAYNLYVAARTQPRKFFTEIDKKKKEKKETKLNLKTNPNFFFTGFCFEVMKYLKATALAYGKSGH